MLSVRLPGTRAEGASALSFLFLIRVLEDSRRCSGDNMGGGKYIELQSDHLVMPRTGWDEKCLQFPYRQSPRDGEATDE